MNQKIRKLVSEVVKQLDCLNSSDVCWWDENEEVIHDPNAPEPEPLEPPEPKSEDDYSEIHAAEWLIHTIAFELNDKLDNRSPNTVDGVWTNVVVFVYDQMKHALTGMTTEIKINLIVEYAQSLERMFQALLGEKYDEFLGSKDA